MIEDKIEIVIPTYNRANFLNNTLNELLNSPFKNCKITIRDNASTDKTPEICEKYSKLFENIHIIKNKKNIGGSENVFRSYEQGTYPYVWVLGDDDYLNFDRCDDFIDAINSEKYDLIICSSERYTTENNPNNYPTPADESISEYIKRNKKNDENYLVNTTQELALIIKRHYFSINGFISSTIYKTEILDSEYLIASSIYIGHSFPHFPFIAKSLNNNLLTYKTKYDVVFKNASEPEDIHGIELYAGFLECTTLIENKQIRTYAEEMNGNKLYFDLAAKIIYSKAGHDPNVKKGVLSSIRTMYITRGWILGFLYNIYIMILYSIPTAFCEFYVKKRESQLKKD